MKTSLLFSSYPFINSEKVTLTRITDMDLEALWQILGDEESHRFTAEGPLDSHRECARRLRRFDTMFQDQRGVVLGIYSTLNQLVGLMKISTPRWAPSTWISCSIKPLPAMDTPLQLSGPPATTCSKLWESTASSVF